MDFLDGLKALGQTVAQFAPELGKVLPIPGGEILGRIVAKQFGGDISKSSELIDIIGQDPQAGVKLIEIQTNYQLEINRLNLQYFLAENADRQRATDREVKLAQAGKDDNTPRNLAYMVTFGFFSFIFVFPYMPLDAGEKDIMMILAGVLASKFSSAFDYFLGTSVGSKVKDATIQAYSKFVGQKTA